MLLTLLRIRSVVRYSIHLLRARACFLYRRLSFDPSLSSLSFSLFIFSFTHMVTHICPSRNHAYMCLVSPVSLDRAASYSSWLSLYRSYMLFLTHMRAPHAHLQNCVFSYHTHIRHFLTEQYENLFGRYLDVSPSWCRHVQYLGFLMGAPTTNFARKRVKTWYLTLFRATKNCDNP